MTTVELLRRARRVNRAADGLLEDPRNPFMWTEAADRWLLLELISEQHDLSAKEYFSLRKEWGLSGKAA